MACFGPFVMHIKQGVNLHEGSRDSVSADRFEEIVRFVDRSIRDLRTMPARIKLVTIKSLGAKCLNLTTVAERRALALVAESKLVNR